MDGNRAVGTRQNVTKNVQKRKLLMGDETFHREKVHNLMALKSPQKISAFKCPEATETCH